MENFLTSAEFQEATDTIFSSCKDLLGEKAKQYSRDDDRFYNFNRSAEMLRCSPQKALLGMWIKHLCFIFDVIEQGLPFSEKFTESIQDSINYHILLWAYLRHMKGVEGEK